MISILNVILFLFNKGITQLPYDLFFSLLSIYSCFIQSQNQEHQLDDDLQDIPIVGAHYIGSAGQHRSSNVGAE